MREKKKGNTVFGSRKSKDRGVVLPLSFSWRRKKKKKKTGFKNGEGPFSGWGRSALNPGNWKRIPLPTGPSGEGRAARQLRKKSL